MTTNPLLTRRSVVLAKTETTYGVDASPSVSTDAMLVTAPEFMATATVIQRNFARDDISQIAPRVGRKIAKLTFTTEFKNNNLGTAPALGRLIKACGFSETNVTGAGCVGGVTPSTQNQGANITWGSAANSNQYVAPVTYIIAVTLGGASGTAQWSITPDADAVAASTDAVQTGVTATTAVALVLRSGTTITPTWTGNLTIGDTFTITVVPKGWQYFPISNNISANSLTLYAYFDGTLHKVFGALGTFSFSGDAGNIITAKFEFTGQYVTLADTALPALSGNALELNTPPIFQSAKLLVDGFRHTINSISFDMQNTINPRPDANQTDGYNGVRLVARDPKGGIDPEATTVANYDFWGKYAASQTFGFKVLFGDVNKNQLWFLAPAAVYTGLTYKDRDGMRVYDAGLAFSRINGNDEIQLLFT